MIDEKLYANPWAAHNRGLVSIRILAQTIEELTSSLDALQAAHEKLIRACDIVCMDLRAMFIAGAMSDFLETIDALEAAIEEARKCRGIPKLEGGAATEVK